MLVQSWSSLMDLGLSPTLGRQVSYVRGSGLEFHSLLRLLRSFELIFVFLAMLSGIAFLLSNNWIASNWIASDNLGIDVISYSLALMALMVGLRWFSSLYRGGIEGFEDQIWLNKVIVLLSCLRYIGSLIIIAYFDGDIRAFFEYQLFIGCVEPIILYRRLHKKLRQNGSISASLSFDWAEVKRVMPYALSVAYSAMAWAFVTQTDRLILSGTITLAEYGNFTLLALVSSGITLMSTPVGQALRPRLTVLFSSKDHVQFVHLYKNTSKFVTWLAFSSAIIVGLYAEALLFAFAGNREAAGWGSEILIWFALGNAFLAISTLQYHLQSAIGDLRLHVKLATIMAITQVPIITFAVLNYGVLGAGIVWFFLRLVFFLFWTMIVHRKFLPRFHSSWLIKDIIPTIIISLLVGIIIHYFLPLSLETNRAILLFKLLLLGSLQLFVSAIILLPLNFMGLKISIGNKA